MMWMVEPEGKAFRAQNKQFVTVAAQTIHKSRVKQKR